jgi:transcriptional regulator with XRE-family HTH domain
VAANPTRTQQPFAEELPRLLAERKLSMRALAREVGLNPSHLSRGLRNVDNKRVSPQLIRRIGVFFGLPAGYFPEEREAFVIERIRSDPALRDRLYSRWNAPPEDSGAG